MSVRTWRRRTRPGPGRGLERLRGAETRGAEDGGTRVLRRRCGGRRRGAGGRRRGWGTPTAAGGGRRRGDADAGTPTFVRPVERKADGVRAEGAERSGDEARRSSSRSDLGACLSKGQFLTPAPVSARWSRDRSCLCPVGEAVAPWGTGLWSRSLLREALTLGVMPCSITVPEEKTLRTSKSVPSGSARWAAAEEREVILTRGWVQPEGRECGVRGRAPTAPPSGPEVADGKGV